MTARVFIPIVDLAFLSLAAIVAILAQAQIVKALPVRVAEIGPGIAAVVREEVAVVAVTPAGLTVDGEPVVLEHLASRVDGRLALLRVHRDERADTVVQIMGALAAAGVELRIEVRTTPRRVGS